MERQEDWDCKFISVPITLGLPLPEEMPYFFAETLYELSIWSTVQIFNKYLGVTVALSDSLVKVRKNFSWTGAPLKMRLKLAQLCDERAHSYKVCFTLRGSSTNRQDCTIAKARGVVGCSRCKRARNDHRVNIFQKTSWILRMWRCDAIGRLTCPCLWRESQRSEFLCRTCEDSGDNFREIFCDHREETSYSVKNKRLAIVSLLFYLVAILFISFCRSGNIRVLNSIWKSSQAPLTFYKPILRPLLFIGLSKILIQINALPYAFRASSVFPNWWSLFLHKGCHRRTAPGISPHD